MRRVKDKVKRVGDKLKAKLGGSRSATPTPQISRPSTPHSAASPHTGTTTSGHDAEPQAPLTELAQDATSTNARTQPALTALEGQQEAQEESQAPASTPLDPPPSKMDQAKDCLKVSGSFLSLLLKKVPDAIDTNPVKVFFSLAKIILELKEGMDENKEAVERTYGGIASLLLVVERALKDWEGRDAPREKEPIEEFERVARKELETLIKIKQQSWARNLAVQEDDKQNIADVFTRVNQAQENLMVATSQRIHIIVEEIKSDLDRLLPEQLKISPMADFKYYHDGADDSPRRECCVPGTRVAILESITLWITNTSTAHPIYWLSGQGGAGKSTIAYTICHRFEFVSDGWVIGGSFFCSRQALETRSASAIIRTIVYRLALKSKAFFAALKACGKFDLVNQSPKDQLIGLLIEPWIRSALGRLAEKEPGYIIPIDAIDELQGRGGVDFLHALIEVVAEHDFPGLKFLVTSRSEPELVEATKGFQEKQIYRLEEVAIEQSSADIKVYLGQKIGGWADERQVQQLAEKAEGLFIYAATVVQYLRGQGGTDAQKNILNSLLRSSPSLGGQPRGLTRTLDRLYMDILDASLVSPGDQEDEEIFSYCLAILHTFLSTMERIQPNVAADLLHRDETIVQLPFANSLADGVLSRLHAVLRQGRNGQVLWFHKSFPDYIFDSKRSGRYFCDHNEHQRRLAEGCFKIMHSGLHFNMAAISSSYQFDQDDPTLPGHVSQNIGKSLRYACEHWGSHLSLTALPLENRLINDLRAFLQLPVLFWLEAMNLLGRRGQCAGTLRSSQKLVQASKDLIDKIGEAAAFSDYHSMSKAAVSTPHLYISSLSTFPRRGSLIPSWRAQFEGLPAFTHATNKHAHHAVFTIGAPVDAISLSNNSTTAVLGCQDGSVRLWDLTTGEELMTLRGHTDYVRAAALSPDGKTIASGSDDNTVRIWDASTGEELKVLKGHDNWVYAVAWSRDGTHIVSGSWDRTARVWDASTGEAKTLEGHAGGIYAISNSTDGIHIASASDDETVRVWDVRTAATVKTFAGHTSSVMAVAFSPDGSHIVSGSYDRTVRVWSIESGEEVKRFEGHTREVRAVAYSPDGARIASGSGDRTVRMWDVTGQEVKKFEGHTGYVNAVAFSNQGTHLVSGSDDGTLRVWDLSVGSNAEESEAQLGEVYAAAFSPDGTRIAVGGSDESIRVWNISAGAEVQKLEGHSATIRSISYTPNGSRIISGSDDDTIRVWDVSTGQQLMTLDVHASGVKAVACSSDGRHAASGSDDNTVRIWDMSTTGTEVRRMEGHTERVWAVAYSPNSTHVFSGSRDTTVRVWDVSTGREVRKLEGHTGEVNTVACSPDGVHIASGSDDYTVRIWNISTGQQVLVLEGHTGLIWSVCYSPDGGHVVSGSWDETVRVWDASTGQEVMKLEGHSSVIRAVAYSPDGTHILSGSRDKTVRLWDVSNNFQCRYTRQRDDIGELTGWLVLPSDPSAHLMFVQPLFGLPDDRNTSTIPPSAFPHLDLSNTKLGPQWAECYTPKA